jgi:hypothetical protein
VEQRSHALSSVLKTIKFLEQGMIRKTLPFGNSIETNLN